MPHKSKRNYEIQLKVIINKKDCLLGLHVIDVIHT